MLWGLKYVQIQNNPQGKLSRARHQLLVKAFLGKHFRARAYNTARGCNRCTTGILVLIDHSP
jgi:hypothetical protein